MYMASLNNGAMNEKSTPKPPVMSINLRRVSSPCMLPITEALCRAHASEEHCCSDSLTGHQMPSTAAHEGIFFLAVSRPSICCRSQCDTPCSALSVMSRLTPAWCVSAVECRADAFEYGVCRTGIGLYVALPYGTSAQTIFVLCHQSVYTCIEHGLIRNLKASAQTQQVLCLAEFLVVGAEEHRYSIYGCFGHIVYACTESSANVCYVAISVDA